MDKSSKRGKIPQTDWPSIMSRYEAGETLASIARTYDCSPPAISYVVSRSRKQQSGTGPQAKSFGASEPQLIKVAAAEAKTTAPAAPAEASANGAATTSPAEKNPPSVNGAIADRREPQEPVKANGLFHDSAVDHHAPAAAHSNGAAPRAPQHPGERASAPDAAVHANGTDHRPKLHLSLGNSTHANSGHANSGHGNGSAAATDRNGAGHTAAPHHPPAQERAPATSHSNTEYVQPYPGNSGAGRNGAHFSETPYAPEPAPQRNGGGSGHRKDGGGTFIDQELRARVDTDIAAFLAAFDAALSEDTQESRIGLREATDRLLRAGARTRIELERLEARVPLTPRDGMSRGEPAWRYR